MRVVLIATVESDGGGTAGACNGFCTPCSRGGGGADGREGSGGGGGGGGPSLEVLPLRLRNLSPSKVASSAKSTREPFLELLELRDPILAGRLLR